MRLSISRFNRAAARNGLPSRKEAATMAGAVATASSVRRRSSCAIRKIIAPIESSA